MTGNPRFAARVHLPACRADRQCAAGPAGEIAARVESTFTRVPASRESAPAHVTLASIHEQLRPVCPGTQKS
jgi:hypothetical protein